jgi:tetratricopeptide (TPR) repeat protein
MNDATPRSISIITPWLDHPEFIADYEQAVAAEDVDLIIVDNGSTDTNARLLREMALRVGGRCLRNAENRWFAAANNQGMAVATGQIILFLNNDIAARPGWLDQVRRDVQPGMLVGPTLADVTVQGRTVACIEGWCIAAQREVWRTLGGWDAQAYSMPYWEDNDLCFRAASNGFALRKSDWPVTHKKNGTSGTMPSVQSGYDRNWQTFSARVLGRQVERSSEAAPAAQTLDAALALHRAGRLAEAERAYLALLDQEPNRPDVLNAYSQLLFASNRLERAAEVLRRAIALQPDSIEMHVNLGVALGMLKRHDEAAAVLGQAAARFPNAPLILNNWAKALKDAGQHEQAVEAARRAIALDRTLVHAHINLSHALRELGQHTSATESARNAILLNPRSAAAHVALGAALKAQGNNVEALRSLETALTLAPTDRVAQSLYDQTRSSADPTQR